MVALMYYYRSPNRIWMGCLIGLAACLGCGSGQAVQAVPGDAEYAKARQLLAEGNLNGAVAAFDEAIKINPNYAPLRSKRADALQLLGKPDDALAGYSDALNLDPTEADAYCGRGAVYLEKGSSELALDDLTQAVRLFPNSYKAFRLRTRANLLAGRYADAIEDARSAIRFNARSSDALHTLRPSLPSSPNQKPDSDVDYLIAAIQPEEPVTAQGRAELAGAYFNLGISLIGRRLEAEKAFGEAKRLDLDYGILRAEYQARTGPANIHSVAKPLVPELTLPQLKFQAFDALKQGLFDIAIDEFTHILEIDARCTDVWVWCGRGSAFLGKNDADSAIPDFERAIYLDPRFAEAYYLRGQAHAKKGFYYQTIIDATEAIRLRPDYAQAYNQRTVAYFKRNSLEHALADLNHAVKLDPGSEVQARSSFAEMCAHPRDQVHRRAGLGWGDRQLGNSNFRR